MRQLQFINIEQTLRIIKNKLLSRFEKEVCTLVFHTQNRLVLPDSALQT